MHNPLDKVPLNTKRVYTVATAKGGCLIYMPVDTPDITIVNVRKDQLQAYLDNQKCGLPPPQLA